MIVRTAISARANSKSGFANLTAAMLVLMTMLFLTPLFYHMPKPILSAIVMMAALPLFDYEELFFLMRVSKTDLMVWIVACLSTMFLGIEVGILIAMAFSLFLVTYRISQYGVVIVGNVDGGSSENVGIDVHPNDGILILRIEDPLIFANCDRLRDAVSSKLDGDAPHSVIVDFSNCNQMDSTACHVLDDIVNALEKANVSIFVVGVKKNIYEMLERSGIVTKIDPTNFHPQFHLAVLRAKEAKSVTLE